MPKEPTKPKWPKPRLKWEGDSKEVITSWPAEVKQNIGGDIRRLQNYEDPLDSKPMGNGLSELRDYHMGVWYRLLYTLKSGWIYILHCFRKKTDKTSQRDINLANARLKRVSARKDPPFIKEEHSEEADREEDDDDENET